MKVVGKGMFYSVTRVEFNRIKLADFYPCNIRFKDNYVFITEGASTTIMRIID